MVTATPALVSVAFLLLPTAGVVAVWIWTRWLGRRTAAPRFAAATGYSLVTLSAVPLAYGVASSQFLGTFNPGSSPSERSRKLAESIAEAMNCGALALIVAFVGALWLAFCTWRWGPTARKRVMIAGALAVVIVAAAAVGHHGMRSVIGESRGAEAIYMVNAIRIAQETNRAETGSYANVSTALAANQSTNHFALYPRRQESRAIPPPSGASHAQLPHATRGGTGRFCPSTWSARYASATRPSRVEPESGPPRSSPSTGSHSPGRHRTRTGSS